MKHLLWGAMLLALLVEPAFARKITVPEEDPSAMVTVPDNWKVEEIEYGYSAMSPGKDVFFSIESAGKNNVDAMIKNNMDWMKEQGIDASVEPKTSEMEFGGLKGSVFRFDTKDSEGPTRVDFVMLPGGSQRVIFLTLWGSADERRKHGDEVDAIMNSVKALQ